jgi:hypothetical protein
MSDWQGHQWLFREPYKVATLIHGRVLEDFYQQK